MRLGSHLEEINPAMILPSQGIVRKAGDLASDIFAHGVPAAAAPGSQLRFLFVGHEASRTGAPLVLLDFLRWFKKNVGSATFSILLAKGGPLEDAFAALAPTVVLDRGPLRHSSLGRRLLRKAGFDRTGEWLHRRALTQRLLPPPALIYCNTVAAGPALEFLDAFDAPVLTHVHELGWFFRTGLSSDQVERLLKRTIHYVACSKVVRDFLTNHHSVPVSAIDVVHEFLIRERPKDVAKPLEAPRLNIPPGAKIVGAVGSLGWRKGTDLLIQVARDVLDRDPRRPVHFVWLGDGEAEERARTEHDIRHARLEDHVTLLDSVEDPFPYYERFDVVVLPSREDPFPLVCLEAAYAATPAVCFGDAGGATEFIESDCGFAVPYLDVKAMSDRVIELLDDDVLRDRMGRTARQKVLARHTVDLAAPQLLQAIAKALAVARSKCHRE